MDKLISFLKRRVEGLIDNLIWYAILSGLLFAFVANQLEVIRIRLSFVSSIWSFLILFLAFLGLVAIIFVPLRFLYRHVKRNVSAQAVVDNLTEPNIQKLILSEGYSVSFPQDRVQEYSFTVINETGIDINDCYVILDATAKKWDEDDEWEIEQVKFVDTPFIWKKSGASETGRIDIEDGDRASFSFGTSTLYYAMDNQTKQDVPLFQFLLTLYQDDDDEKGYELYLNYLYKLQISIRAKANDGQRLPVVTYELYIRPTESSGPAGGFELHGIERGEDTVRK